MDEDALTKEFREQMDDLFPNHCFYRLNTYNNTGGAKHIKEKDIEKFNNAKEKYCIFFTPHGEFALSGGTRQKDTAKRVFSFSVDIDHTLEPIREDFDLAPSIVNRTKNGHHVYWLIEATNYTEKRYELQDFLVKKLNADTSAKDVARLMRLPNTRYRKDKQGDFYTKTVLFEPENKYTKQDFIDVRDKYQEVEKVKKYDKGTVDRDSRSIVDDIDTQVDVLEVFNKLQHKLGRTYDVQSSGAIKENGQRTDGYKYWEDQNAIINFSRHENQHRPEGGPFSIAKHILGSNIDAFEYFYEEYKIGNSREEKLRKPRKMVNEEDAVETIEIPAGKNTKIIVDFMKGMTFIEKITNDGRSKSILMKAAFEPKGWYKKNNERFVVVKYQKENGDTGVISFGNFSKSREFETKLNAEGIMLRTSITNNVRVLIEYFLAEQKEVIAIDKVGVYEGGLRVFSSGQALYEDDGEVYFIDIEDIGAGRDAKRPFIHESEATSKQEFITVMQSFIDSYDPMVSATAFGAYCMSLFVRDLRMIFDTIPMVTFVGQTQSGKTVLRRNLMKIFGIDKKLEVQASTTEFAMMKMVLHHTPLNVGEFQNQKIRYNRDVFIKNLYDGTSNMRGTAKQTTISYHSNAMIFVDGQYMSMENAVQSRNIVLYMSPSQKQGLPQNIKNVNSYLLDNYDNIKKIQSKSNKRETTLSETIADLDVPEKDRIITNYASILAFADAFGFVEHIEDHVIAQMKSQIGTLSDDDIKKTITRMFGLLRSKECDVSLDAERMALQMTMGIDALRYQEDKINDLTAQMKISNHHFGFQAESDDILYIDLEYLMKNRWSHTYLIKALNQISHENKTIPNKIKKVLQTFAISNDYKSEPFYEYGKMPNVQDGSF